MPSLVILPYFVVHLLIMQLPCKQRDRSDVREPTHRDPLPLPLPTKTRTSVLRADTVRWPLHDRLIGPARFSSARKPTPLSPGTPKAGQGRVLPLAKETVTSAIVPAPRAAQPMEASMMFPGGGFVEFARRYADAPPPFHCPELLKYSCITANWCFHSIERGSQLNISRGRCFTASSSISKSPRESRLVFEFPLLVCCLCPLLKVAVSVEFRNCHLHARSTARTTPLTCIDWRFVSFPHV